MLCAKSPWTPAVRREHALALEAAAAGHPVTFVEQPADVRAAGGAWARRLVRPARSAPAAGVAVVERSTLVPGHRSAVAQRVDHRLLGRVLARASTASSSLVCCVPWDWPAVAAAPGARRVFDMADDWGELMPGRRERFAALYDRIAREADAIVVVNEDLCRHFGAREVEVIRNGVPAWMVGAPAGPPAERTMLYVGTLSPRFDAPLMGAVLATLPDWTLELIGPCLYPGRGDRPDDELAALLARPEVRWDGPLPREALPDRLDAAAVLILPNRPAHSVGQDSMKLYDYSARGRPIVSTTWSPRLADEGPPHLALADDPAAFADAVRAAASAPAAWAGERRAWGASQTWDARWPVWRAAVTGAPVEAAA